MGCFLLLRMWPEKNFGISVYRYANSRYDKQLRGTKGISLTRDNVIWSEKIAMLRERLEAKPRWGFHE